MFLFTLVTSCNSDDDSNGINNGNINAITNVVKTGTWKITTFSENGNDETNNFTGYNFTFGDNNVLTATNGADVHTGTWSVTTSNSSSDDNSANDIDFNIGFVSPQEFTDLSDDWDIIEYSSGVIKLIDVSGGNGGTDYLTFEKN
ncbi:hypothetical protein K1I41_07230 [Flavobacterium litorale]|uniref:Lipocalin-like domain-containing protein n=2 Tax=Flavobacterium litorale TaxID=2856519 RepID=A0ABX8VEA2_9FLAO|nr:hypothetical protein K1I41_07230 [Flavobacterium litorale]